MQYLEAMDASPYEIRSNYLFSLAKQSTKKNKPLVKLGNPSSNMMDVETFAALSACELLMLNHLKVDHNLFVGSAALLESLKTLHKVKSLMLDFNFRSLPSTEYIQSLIRVLVKLDHLKDLKLLFIDDAETLDEYKAIESITRSIVVNQYEFPVLKSFSCTLPMIDFRCFQSN